GPASVPPDQDDRGRELGGKVGNRGEGRRGGRFNGALPRPVRAEPACRLDWRVASAVVGRAPGPESPGGPRKEPRIRKTVSDPNRTSRSDDSGSVAASRSCARLLISVPRWCLPTGSSKTMSLGGPGC